MRYCPPCHRYVSDAAFSCAGCGNAATRLPYVGPDEPLNQPQTTVELPAPAVPPRVVALHAAPQTRRSRARFAPALLVAGLGFAGICGVAGSAEPGGTASAQGSLPFTAPTPPLGGGDGPARFGGGPGATGNIGTAPDPSATVTSPSQRGSIEDTAPVAAVAPAPTTSTTGSAPSLTPVAPPVAAAPSTTPPPGATMPVTVTSTVPSTPPTPAPSSSTPSGAPTPVVSVTPTRPDCGLELLGICL